MVNALQGLFIFSVLFFDDAVLKFIKVKCISWRNQDENPQENLISMKIICSCVRPNQRRVYSLDQSLPVTEERFMCSFKQHSDEF